MNMINIYIYICILCFSPSCPTVSISIVAMINNDDDTIYKKKFAFSVPWLISSSSHQLNPFLLCLLVIVHVLSTKMEVLDLKGALSLPA